jgi:autophagy-related protein 11
MTPSSGPSALIASYRRVLSEHQETISHILDSMRYQQSALRIASTALDRCVLDVTNLFNEVAASARQELEMQASLIASVDTDIDMASRIQIHRDFLSPAALRATGAGGPARTLGYYISSERMHQVQDACQRTHGIPHAPIRLCSCSYRRR